MAAKSSDNEMLDEDHPKCKKMAAKLSRNEMLIFGLHLMIGQATGGMKVS